MQGFQESYLEKNQDFYTQVWTMHVFYALSKPNYEQMS